MISTRDLSGLPDINGLRRLLQSLTMMDAILCRDWEERYFSFNSVWARDEQLGSMRNGEGDHLFAFFSASGCWLKGFSHEADATVDLETVPPEFAACLTEPALAIDETTFCIWRRYADHAWESSPASNPESNGSAALLHWLDGRPETYRAWAQDYYEREVALAPVEAIYAHVPLDQTLLDAIGADVKMGELSPDAAEIGYPVR